MNDVHCQHHEVAKIEVRLCCGGIRGDLVVPTPDRNHKLSLVTLPEASAQADEVFVILNGWCEQFKPGWLRKLRAEPPVAIGIAGILVIVFALIAGFTGSIATKDPWRDDVSKLIDKGVKPEDHGRALELVLEKLADPQGGRKESRLPTWFFVFSGITFIGKGAASVRWQKQYDRFLRKTIPAFVIFGVLTSALGSYVFEFFHSK